MIFIFSIVATLCLNAQVLWTPVGHLPAGICFETIAVHPNGNMFAKRWWYGTIWRSTDNGSTWSELPQSPHADEELSFDDAGNIYCLRTDDGIYRSTDNGDTWTNLVSQSSLPESVKATHFRPLGIAPLGSLFIGSGDEYYPSGLIRSTDLGLTWTTSDTGLPFDASPRGASLWRFTFHSSGTVIAVMFYPSHPNVYCSADDGSTWENTGLDWPWLNAVFAESPTGDVYMTDGTGNGPPEIYCSTNAGRSWFVSSSTPSLRTLWCSKLIFSPNGVFFCGLSFSPDGGTHWVKMTAGLSTSGYALAIDSSNYAYVCSGSGQLYRSRFPLTHPVFTKSRALFTPSYPSGWNLVSVPVKTVIPQVCELFPTASSNLYSHDGRKYRTNDTVEIGRGYWLKFSETTKVGWFDDDVAIVGDPVTIDTIAVASGWNIVGSLNEPIAVRTITSDPPGMVASSFFGYIDGNYVRADTLQPGQGYWVKYTQPGSLILNSEPALSGTFERIRVVPSDELPPPPPDGDVSTSQPASIIPDEYVLQQNCPNPFNPTTDLRFEIGDMSFVTLKVFDVLGRELATLVDEVKQPGKYMVRWDATGQPSGVYFYRLVAGSFTEVKKMLLLR